MKLTFLNAIYQSTENWLQLFKALLVQLPIAIPHPLEYAGCPLKRLKQWSASQFVLIIPVRLILLPLYLFIQRQFFDNRQVVESYS